MIAVAILSITAAIECGIVFQHIEGNHGWLTTPLVQAMDRWFRKPHAGPGVKRH